MADSPPPQASAPSVSADPDERLARMEDRLARIEELLLDQRRVTEQVPDAVAFLADTFDGAVDNLARRGVDVDARIQKAAEVAEKLTDPSVLDSLTGAVDLARSVPATAAAAMDTFDGIVAKLAEQGVDVDQRLQTVIRVAERLTAPEALDVVCQVLANVDALRALLDSGVFRPRAVHMVGRAAEALSQVDLTTIQPVGTFGALRALREPDMRRALGVLVEIGKRFGQACEKKPAAHQAQRAES